MISFNDAVANSNVLFHADIDRRRSWLAVSRRGDSNSSRGDAASKSNSVVTGPTAANRRGRFIVLGSSGECLPVNRKSQVINAESTVATTLQRCDSNSIYSSCDSGNSEDEEYHSARTSFEDCIEGITCCQMHSSIVIGTEFSTLFSQMIWKWWRSIVMNWIPQRNDTHLLRNYAKPWGNLAIIRRAQMTVMQLI